MTNETLSKRFAEHAAAAYKRTGLSDEDYWLQQLGRQVFNDRDVILAALRSAERPTPSHDATEAARAMRAMREAAAKVCRDIAESCRRNAQIHRPPYKGVNEEIAKAHESGEQISNYILDRIEALPLPTPQPDERDGRKFSLGDRVTKLRGSCWTGHVVGFYSTSLTPLGYAVESETEIGSVQIYPERALAAKSKGGEG